MDPLQNIVSHAPNLIGLGIAITFLWRVHDALSVRLTECEKKYERLVQAVLEQTSFTADDVRRVEENGNKLRKQR